MQWHSHSVCTEIAQKVMKIHPFAHISVAAIQTVHVSVSVGTFAANSWLLSLLMFSQPFRFVFLALISAGGLNLRQLILSYFFSTFDVSWRGNAIDAATHCMSDRARERNRNSIVFYFLFVWRKCVSVSIIASRNCHPKCSRHKKKPLFERQYIRLQFCLCSRATPPVPLHRMFASVHCVNLCGTTWVAVRKLRLFCHYLIGCCIGFWSSLSLSLSSIWLSPY